MQGIYNYQANVKAINSRVGTTPPPHYREVSISTGSHRVQQALLKNRASQE